MGGSILGAEAIYFFLKKKIKKEFLFLDNINEHKLKKIKKTNKFKKTLFILISNSTLNDFSIWFLCWEDARNFGRFRILKCQKAQVPYSPYPKLKVRVKKEKSASHDLISMKKVRVKTDDFRSQT